MMNPKALFSAPPAARGSAFKQITEGLRYAWRTPRILIIFIVVASIGTFGYNFSVVLPLLANFVLNTDAAGFGALSSFLGGGSLIAALSTAYVQHVTLKRLLVGAGLFSILLGMVALVRVFAISAFLLVILGASGIIFTTSANTLLQLTVPDSLRGRIMSLNVLLIMGSTPIGAFLIGVMSNALGVPAALLTCAALCMAGVIIALLYQHSRAYRSSAVNLPGERGTT